MPPSPEPELRASLSVMRATLEYRGNLSGVVFIPSSPGEVNIISFSQVPP